MKKEITLLVLFAAFTAFVVSLGAKKAGNEIRNRKEVKCPERGASHTRNEERDHFTRLVCRIYGLCGVPGGQEGGENEIPFEPDGGTVLKDPAICGPKFQYLPQTECGTFSPPIRRHAINCRATSTTASLSGGLKARGDAARGRGSSAGRSRRSFSRYRLDGGRSRA